MRGTTFLRLLFTRRSERERLRCEGFGSRAFYLLARRFFWNGFSQAVLEVQMHQHRTYGDPARLALADTSQVNDALFNVNSGTIRVGEDAFFGSGVSVITGWHDPLRFGADRRVNYPSSGRDIEIEAGVWVGSNATILGPCRIGAHAVVAAMSLVREDVAPYTVVAGIPARVIKHLPEPVPADA
jgi:acetyltransferase-like isoleucine patch superfamily enzyme